MTLNITLLAPFAIYQSADFRLTDLDTGRLMTDQSAKTVILQYNSWSGFVTYTGLGSWYGRSVSEFVVDWLTDGVARSSMNDVALHLESGGTRLLTDVQQRSGYSVRHTFTLAGFENNAIRAFVISNFEDGRGATRNTAASSLSTTVRELHRNSGAVTIVTGSSRAVPVAQLRLLRRMAIAHAEDGGLIRRRLEAINATAARSPASRGTISEQCAVTSFRFDGYGRLQLGDETGPRPGKIPVIISGVELNRTLQDAAKRIGIDFSNAQMSNATFVSTRNPGPASAKSRPCGFPVSTSDISNEYVLQEITAGDFEPLMASDINDAGHVTGTGRDERQVPWTRQIPWLWKEGQAERLNFEGQAFGIGGGDVVAAMLQDGAGERAAIYAEQSIKVLPLGDSDAQMSLGTNSSVAAVNSAGTVAGYVRTETGVPGEINMRAAILRVLGPPVVANGRRSRSWHARGGHQRARPGAGFRQQVCRRYAIHLVAP